MSSIPEDLIGFALFAAFVLVQVVRALRRNKAQRTTSEPVATAGTDIHTPPEAEAETPAQPSWTPTLAEGPQPKKVPAPARPAQAPTRLETRRFSRRRLMGDRRSLQDGIVVAIILGPCLALQPRDTE